METSNLDIELLSLNQARKEVTVNEALIKIDALLNTSIIDIGTNNPPENPKNGDLYAIGDIPTGQWEGRKNQLAFWYYNNWYFLNPKIGLYMFIQSKNRFYFYNGKKWAINPTLVESKAAKKNFNKTMSQITN